MMGWAESGSAAAAAGQMKYDTIALSGATGSSLGLGPNVGAGVNFDSFISTPVLNAAGDVAFYGVLGGTGVDGTNYSGLWSTAGGTLSLVARQGVNFGNFNDFASLPPVLNADGEVAFYHPYYPAASIWSTVGGTLAVVAREGNAGPGPNVGAGVNFISFGNHALNAAGEVAFNGQLTGTGVTSANNTGIWSTVGGTLAVVAREGNAGPGPNVGTGVNFSSLGGPVLNSAGAVAFGGTLTGTGVLAGNDGGIWSTVGGTLAVVAREGGGGPGPNVGAGVNFSSLGSPVINAAGEIAFRGDLTGTGVNSANDSGIWSTAGGTLTVVAREGSGAPGLNLGLGGALFGPVINAAGEVAFRSRIGNSDYGIWSNTGGTLAVVALSGNVGPGPNVGTGVNFSFLDDPSINAAGDVAFRGILTGTGVDDTNDGGLWSTAGGVLHVVVREGELFDVDPGPGMDLRTISHIDFGLDSDPSGGEDGRTLTFNDDGLLTFELEFTDDSSGIFTAMVPEPSGLAMLSASALALLRRVRRRAVQCPRHLILRGRLGCNHSFTQQ
jgi:hypothetical protein